MMVAFNITSLQDLGYTEKTKFINPMDPTYRAKPFGPGDYSNRLNDFAMPAIDKKCDELEHLEAYANAVDTEKALEDYWSSRKSGKIPTTAPSVGATTAPATTAAAAAAAATTTAKVAPVTTTFATAARTTSKSSVNKPTTTRK
jgi:hypothetical protein